MIFDVSFLYSASLTELCGEESEWLDQLEDKLQRPPKEAADAEEISETLDVSCCNWC